MFKFEIDENGNLDTSKLSLSDLKLVYIYLNQLLIAVKQVNANNLKLISKQINRGKVAGVKSLNTLFTKEDGKFNNSNLANGDFFNYDYVSKKYKFSINKFESNISNFTQQILNAANFPEDILKAAETGSKEAEELIKEKVDKKFKKILSNNSVFK